MPIAWSMRDGAVIVRKFVRHGTHEVGLYKSQFWTTKKDFTNNLYFNSIVDLEWVKPTRSGLISGLWREWNHMYMSVVWLSWVTVLMYMYSVKCAILRELNISLNIYKILFLLTQLCSCVWFIYYGSVKCMFVLNAKCFRNLSIISSVNYSSR